MALAKCADGGNERLRSTAHPDPLTDDVHCAPRRPRDTVRRNGGRQIQCNVRRLNTGAHKAYCVRGVRGTHFVCILPVEVEEPGDQFPFLQVEIGVWGQASSQLPPQAQALGQRLRSVRGRDLPEAPHVRDIHRRGYEAGHAAAALEEREGQIEHLQDALEVLDAKGLVPEADQRGLEPLQLPRVGHDAHRAPGGLDQRLA